MTDPAAAAASDAAEPVTSGMLIPTSNMNRNEMPVEARRSAGVSWSRCFISMPITKAGSSTSMWMLFSGPYQWAVAR